MASLPRIVYNSIAVDLSRQFNAFNIVKLNRLVKAQAQSGIEQFASFYDQDIITAERDRLIASEVCELLEWWEYVKDGSTFHFERDRLLGTFIGWEGKSLNTNDELAGSFSRGLVTNSSYYLDGGTGLVTVVNSADVARFPLGVATIGGRSVLIEGSRKNEIDSPSTDFDGVGNWQAASNITDTNNTNEQTDPTGANGAVKLAATGAGGFIQNATGVNIGTTDGAASIYLKSDTGNVECTLEIRRSDTGVVLGTSGATNIPANGPDGNGYTKLTASYESSGSLATNYLYRMTITNSGDVVYAWGAQLEQGTDVLFSSSVINDNVTRNHDNYTYTITQDNDSIGLYDIVNPIKGTIMFWFKPQWIYNKHATALFFIISKNASAPNGDRFLSFEVNSAGNFGLLSNDSAGNLAHNLTTSASGVTQGAWHHAAVVYDSQTANSGKIYLNGSLLATDSNGIYSPNPIGTTIRIGSLSNTEGHAFSEIDDFVIRKEVLPASSILDTYNAGLKGKGLGIKRNRWSSMSIEDPNWEPIWTTGNQYRFSLRAKETIS